MGWWSVSKQEEELYVGDGPLDLLESAMKKIIRLYKKDLKRKPIPEEVAELLEAAIRTLEEEIFDDMEERELESVTIRLKRRPQRPRPKPGDYFAIPLPEGGYGFARVMKIGCRILMWMRLLNVSSGGLLSVNELKGAQTIIDLHCSMDKIIDMSWPILGHEPLCEEERSALLNEPRWITNHAYWSIERIANWKLSGKRGLPSVDDIPYIDYHEVDIRPRKIDPSVP